MEELRKDLEDICDRVTIQEGSMEACEYGKLLIKAIQMLRAENVGEMAAFAGEKEYGELQQRILRIAEYTPYEKQRVRNLCMRAATVLAGIFVSRISG